MKKMSHKYAVTKIDMLQEMIGSLNACVKFHDNELSVVMLGLETLAYLEEDHKCQACNAKITAAMEVIAKWIAPVAADGKERITLPTIGQVIH